MSTLEKVINLALTVVVIIVLAVFCMGMVALVKVWLKWLRKGTNPVNKFPYSRKGVTLSYSRQQALNVGAILAEVNGDFCNSLETSPARAKNVIVRILAEDWGIYFPQGAIKELERLQIIGHRLVSDIVLKNVPEVLSPIHSFENVRQVYDQAGVSLLGEGILEDCPNEVALVEKHIDMLLNALSDEEVEQHKELFGDDEIFLTCKRIHRILSKRLTNYVSYIHNLKQTMPELQKRGVVGDGSELAHLSVAAWDMGRMVNVARYSYDCGYISKSQAWEYILFAGEKSASCYADWTAFGKAYIIGRAMWGGSSANISATISTVEKLQKDKNSPWMRVPLK